MRTLVIVLCSAVLSAATAPRPALAEEGATGRAGGTLEERKQAARTMALKGFDFLYEGKYEKAIALFVEADKLYHAPTIMLLLAEAHERMGKLAEAHTFYQAIVAEALPRTAPREFFEAQVTAKRSLEALAPRLATLEVLVPGATAREVTVKVDGTALTPSDGPHAQNPGRHMVTVSVEGGGTVSQAVTLKEGRAERVVIPRAAIMSAGRSLLSPATVAFSAGVIGVGIGTVAGLITLDRVNDFEAACSSGQCPAGTTTNSAGTWAAVSTAGFVAGGIGLGASAVMLFMQRWDSGSSEAGVQAALGPGSIQLTGAF